jgi:undecaprenyl pyrophosphate phosphatase UppP
MSVWAPISSEAQLIIPRMIDKLNESIKSLKICFVLVF